MSETHVLQREPNKNICGILRCTRGLPGISITIDRAHVHVLQPRSLCSDGDRFLIASGFTFRMRLQ